MRFCCSPFSLTACIRANARHMAVLITVPYTATGIVNSAGKFSPLTKKMVLEMANRAMSAKYTGMNGTRGSVDTLRRLRAAAKTRCPRRNRARPTWSVQIVSKIAIQERMHPRGALFYDRVRLFRSAVEDNNHHACNGQTMKNSGICHSTTRATSARAQSTKPTLNSAETPSSCNTPVHQSEYKPLTSFFKC